MSKNQKSQQKSQQKAQQKADELFAEALVCSKMATKNKRANFEGIKSKFWRTVAKLEKINRENQMALSTDQKRKLDQAKMKF